MMKRTVIILLVIFCSFKLQAQESNFALSGGYVFTNIEEVDQQATGFRINGLYEFNPMEGMLAHGISVGYLRTTASNTVNSQTTKYTFSNFPIYYAPKVMFGSESFKGFIKGALGFHYSGYKRTGEVTTFDTWDFGFYGGAGAGIMKTINDKVFINVEYEWAYLSNTSFRDGFVNTIMGGIGFKF
jgi:opacity protein-like surface antigen